MRMVDDKNLVFQWGKKVSLGCWTTGKVLLVLKELSDLRHILTCIAILFRYEALGRRASRNPTLPRKSLLAYGCRYNTRVAHAVQAIIMKREIGVEY
jgi:hypothetical protein